MDGWKNCCFLFASCLWPPSLSCLLPVCAMTQPMATRGIHCISSISTANLDMANNHNPSLTSHSTGTEGTAVLLLAKPATNV